MYLFFDTETTGLPKDWKAPVSQLSNWPRLVQLAYLIFDAEGNNLEAGNFIIRPDGFIIPPEASRVHGISTARAIEEGQDLKSVLLDFVEKCEEMQFLVAHNMAFDEKIMGAELLRNGFVNIISQKKRICTMQSSTNFCNIPGPYGPKWPKLSELHMKLFQTNFEEAHNASVDINATARCFWELKKLGKI